MMKYIILFSLLVSINSFNLNFNNLRLKNKNLMMNSDAAEEFGSVPPNTSTSEIPMPVSVSESSSTTTMEENVGNDDEVPFDMDSVAEEASNSAFANIQIPDEPIERKAPRQAGWFPMLLSPEPLDGTYAGDVGFDPLGFASDSDKLASMREAEIKHARLAMLGVIGWPSSELWHNNLAEFLDLDSILAENGKAPSVLNGGLSNEWIIGTGVIAIIIGGLLEFGAMNKGDKTKPGDYNFDPLRLYSFRSSFGLDTITEKLSAEEKIARAKYDMEYCEIRHGRAAMLGILGMVLQEYISGIPVVQQTPFFFGDPIF